MRRGLISWSKDEVPAAVLEARVARLQQAMGAAGLDAVLAYTSTVQPAAVSWLTQFVPYSNDAILVVLREGRPAFLANFSKRVQDWIREVSLVGELVMTPHLGKGVIRVLEAAGLSASSRIGLIDADRFPWSVSEPMAEAGWGAGLVDAGEVFRSVRHPADAAEIAQAARAASLASAALDSVAPSAGQASRALSCAEASARLNGAEEVLLKVAPDLARDAAFRRMEGDVKLGRRFAVQASVAYKGVWARAIRCFSADGATPREWQDASRAFEHALGALGAQALDKGLQKLPGSVLSWSVEACVGTQPLTVVAAGSGEAAGKALLAVPAGALCVVTAQVQLAGERWYAASTFVLGGNGQRSRAVLETGRRDTAEPLNA